MKTSLLVMLVVNSLATQNLWAADVPPSTAVVATPTPMPSKDTALQVPVTPSIPTLTQPQLERLVAPIALYPDNILALVLPAATSPTDIVLAARYLRSGGSVMHPALDATQSWEPTVTALLPFKEIIYWLDDNIAWTTQLGSNFQARPQDIMQSIQNLRLKAIAVRTLYNTPQQTIVRNGNVIVIEPTDPELLYLPVYDPFLVFNTYVGFGPAIRFGISYRDPHHAQYLLDWNHHTLWIDPRLNTVGHLDYNHLPTEVHMWSNRRDRLSVTPQHFDFALPEHNHMQSTDHNMDRVIDRGTWAH